MKTEEKIMKDRQEFLLADFISKEELVSKNFKVLKFGNEYPAKHGWCKNLFIRLESGEKRKLCIGCNSALDNPSFEGLDCSIETKLSEESGFKYYVFIPPIKEEKE